MPAHDRPRVTVDDERDIDEPRTRPDIGEVRAQRSSGFAALKSRSSRSPAGLPSFPGTVVRGFPTHHTVHVLGAHEAVDLAVRRPMALAAQMSNHFAPTVEPLRCSLEPMEGIDDHRIVAITFRRAGALPGSVGSRSDPAALLGEDLADRLDSDSFLHCMTSTHNSTRGCRSPKPAIRDRRGRNPVI